MWHKRKLPSRTKNGIVPDHNYQQQQQLDVLA